MKKQNNDITIKGLIDIFLPKWWLILIISLVAAAVLGTYSFIQEDTFTSRGKYLMSKINMSDNSAQTGLNSGEVEAMHIMISNADEMINTKNFAQEVKIRLEQRYGITDYSESQITSMMNVALVSNDTTCYYFTVVSNNPEHSMAIADVAGQYLVEQYKEKTMYAVSIQRIDDPLIPASRNSKHITRNALIGFAGGFLFALILVFVISRFDVVIRTRDKLENAFDIPILGVVPRLELEV